MMNSVFEKITRGIQHCQRCERSQTRHHVVPGEGPRNARVLLVAEAPGKNEDKTGRPFTGRAGRYLDKILQEYEIDRTLVFITSVLKCYHPDPPKHVQMQICHTWTEKQVTLNPSGNASDYGEICGVESFGHGSSRF